MLDNSTQVLMMPTSLRNNRKRAFISPPLAEKLPQLISPFDTAQEGLIVEALLRDINSTYGLGLDIHPDLSRSDDPGALPISGRLVLIGASHMRRIAKELRTAGVEVIDLSVPGWTASKEKIEHLTAELSGLALTSADVVVFDIWSNSVYLGSDEDGFPAKPTRSAVDGIYHLAGNLQVAPKGVSQRILQDCTPMFDASASAGVMVAVPIPRYLTGKCCGDESHITNFGSPDYLDEVGKVSALVPAAVAGLLSLGKVKLISLIECSETTDPDPTSVNPLLDPANWTDPVHLASHLYAKAASCILNKAAEMTAGPDDKHRARLDSIAPVPRITAGGRGGRGVSLPAWVTGRGAGQARPTRGLSVYRGRTGFRKPAPYSFTRGRGGGDYAGRPWRGGMSRY